ncbi:hypothetical protein I4U23_026661 [Adineta vaga]|nr:hypothetical protein I4U23_026661 [Adineta vaga]
MNRRIIRKKMIFERHHICHYPTQISACFLSLSDIDSQLSSFFLVHSLIHLRNEKKKKKKTVTNASLAATASSLSSIDRSLVRKRRNRRRKRLSNKTKDD